MYEYKLAHVLFVAGNSGLKYLMHIDKVEEYLNSRRIEAESNRQSNVNSVEEDKEVDKINGGIEAEYEEH